MLKNQISQGLRISDKDGNKLGTIVAVETKMQTNSAIVSWDDGQICNVKYSKLKMVPNHSGDLEKEFMEISDKIGNEIKSRINEANKALNEALKLAEDHGLPFYSDIIQVGSCYVPNSYHSKWDKLNPEFVSDITEVLSGDLKYTRGWSTSEVC